MPVPTSLLIPGNVFRFIGGDKKVVRIVDQNRKQPEIYWVFADGVSRGGRIDGCQQLRYFARDAIRQIHQPVAEEKSADGLLSMIENLTGCGNCTYTQAS